jgi:hypothetical protein
MIDQSKILSRSQVQFITLLCLEVHNFVVTFTSHGKVHEFGAKKPAQAWLALKMNPMEKELSIRSSSIQTGEFLGAGSLGLFNWD